MLKCLDVEKENQIHPTFLKVIFIDTSEENMHIDIQGLNSFLEKEATKMRAVTITFIPWSQNEQSSYPVMHEWRGFF